MTDQKRYVSILMNRVPRVSGVPQVPRGEKSNFGTKPRGTRDTCGTRGT